MDCIITIEEGKDKIIKKYDLKYIKNIYDFLSNPYETLKLEKYKNIIILKKSSIISEDLFNLLDNEVSFVSTYKDFYIENYNESSNCIDGEIFITNYSTLLKLKKVEANIKDDEDKYKLFLKINKKLFSPLPFGMSLLIKEKD